MNNPKQKKIIIIFLISLFSISLFASSNLDVISGIRKDGMGGISISDSSSAVGVYSNPALLYYREQESSFLINMSYQDNFIPSESQFGCFLQNPISGVNILFASNNISLGIETEINLHSRTVDNNSNTINFKALNTTRLSLGLALGNNFVSAGIGFFGGSSKQKLNVPIREGSILSDYLGQSYFSTYDPINKSEFAGATFGLALKLGGFKIGYSSFEQVSSGPDSFEFIWENLFKNSSLGFSYSSDSYNSEGRLRNIAFFVAAEFRKIFVDTGSFGFGTEISLQLSPDYKVHFRTGLSIPNSNNQELNSSFSLGLGAKIDFVDIDFAVILPFNYMKEGSSSGEYPHFGIGSVFRL